MYMFVLYLLLGILMQLHSKLYIQRDLLPGILLLAVLYIIPTQETYS